MKGADRGVSVGADGEPRCSWCAGDAQYTAYHDHEWGFPVVSDDRLFETLCLEGFQSGLSWLVILRKREHFRRAFAGFDFERVARFTPKRIEILLQDPGIVRHRRKIEAAMLNARRACDLAEEFGSLASYFRRFEPAQSARPQRIECSVVWPVSKTPESTALSLDLKRRGFVFVGPTTMYSFMQAIGLVNDHVEGCHVRAIAERARKRR